MSISDAVRALGIAVAVTVMGACSFITEFDPNKLPHEGPDAAAGAAGVLGGGGSTGASGGGAMSSGGVPGGVAGATDAGGNGGVIGNGGAASGGTDSGTPPPPPPACDVATNQGCAADELCCAVGQGVTCRKTSLKECAQCNVACPTGEAAACTARTCECGTGSKHVCSGTAEERFCATGPTPACAECRDATDCAGRTDGKSLCVAGRCSACDPSHANAGCSGNTPICDPTTRTCRACKMSPDDCIPPLVCTVAGACGHCAGAADCTTKTSPICDATTTACRACASNAECVAGPKLPYCIDKTCTSCNPSTEIGCNDATRPDCRIDATGGYSCQPCTRNEHCATRPATPICETTTGRCVVCAGDNDCPNPKTPFCVNNACVACDASPYVTIASDLRCALKVNGQPACIHTGTQKGQCGACDPGDSRGCTNAQLCCETAGVAGCIRTSGTQCTACANGACDPLVANACTNRGCRCGSSAPCSGSGTTRFCIGSSCAECRSDADCGSAAAPLCENNHCVACNVVASPITRCSVKQPGTVCATSGALQGHCAACDPASNAGCTDPTLNQCDPATATCVDCVDGNGCSGTLDRCNTTTHKCVDCDAAGGCSGTLDKCNLTTSTCVDCDATGGCSGTLDRCNLATSTCVDCDATGGCADVPTKPLCVQSVCTACTSDAQCAALAGSPGPLCGASGACGPDVTCATGADCKDGVHVVCVLPHVDAAVPAGHCRAP